MADLNVGTGAIAAAGALTGAEILVVLQSLAAKELTLNKLPFWTGSEYLLTQTNPIIRFNAGGGAISAPSANRLSFLNNGTVNERMSITSTGFVNIGGSRNIGVGDLQGSGQLRVFASSAGGYAITTYDTTDHTAMQFVRDVSGVPSQKGSITVTTGGTAYNTTSDYRQKIDVRLVKGALDRINAIQVHRFAFVSEPARRVNGFLAHEIALIIPEAVTGVKDGEEEIGTATLHQRDEGGHIIVGATITIENIPKTEAPDGAKWKKTGTRPVYQGIDQSKIVPDLVAAVQELSAKISALEAAAAQK